MTPKEIAELRRMLNVEPGPYHPDIDGPRHAAAWLALPKLLDEREALLNAAKEAAEGFDVIAADDMRLLALLRDAIAKAESP